MPSVQCFVFKADWRTQQRNDEVIWYFTVAVSVLTAGEKTLLRQEFTSEMAHRGMKSEAELATFHRVAQPLYEENLDFFFLIML